MLLCWGLRSLANFAPLNDRNIFFLLLPLEEANDQHACKELGSSLSFHSRRHTLRLGESILIKKCLTALRDRHG